MNILSILVFCIVLCLSWSSLLWAQCWQCLWIVHSAFPLRFSLAFIDYIQRKKSNIDDAEYLTPVTTDVMQVDLRSLNNVMY